MPYNCLLPCTAINSVTVHGNFAANWRLNVGTTATVPCIAYNSKSLSISCCMMQSFQYFRADMHGVDHV